MPRMISLSLSLSFVASNHWSLGVGRAKPFKRCWWSLELAMMAVWGVTGFCWVCYRRRRRAWACSVKHLKLNPCTTKSERLTNRNGALFAFILVVCLHFSPVWKKRTRVPAVSRGTRLQTCRRVPAWGSEARCPPENVLCFNWRKFFSLCSHWLVFQVDSGPEVRLM